MMTAYVLSFLAACVVLSVLSILWHNVLFHSLYYQGLKDVARVKENTLDPNVALAALVDALTVLGIMYFVLSGLPQQGRYLYSALRGAGLGFLVVGTRAIMNYGLLRSYSPKVVAIDVLRGLLMGAIVGIVLVLVFGAVAG